MADTETGTGTEGGPVALAGPGLDDLVAEVRRRVDGEGALYEAFDLKRPDEVTLNDFEDWIVAEYAVGLGCLPTLHTWDRDDAMTCLREAATYLVPGMDAHDRNKLLCDFGLIDDLERIEALLASGRTGEALAQLRRFVRPVWMDVPDTGVPDTDAQGATG